MTVLAHSVVKLGAVFGETEVADNASNSGTPAPPCPLSTDEDLIPGVFTGEEEASEGVPLLLEVARLPSTSSLLSLCMRADRDHGQSSQCRRKGHHEGTRLCDGWEGRQDLTRAGQQPAACSSRLIFLHLFSHASSSSLEPASWSASVCSRDKRPRRKHTRNTEGPVK